MARHDIDFSELLDLDRLMAECQAALGAKDRALLDMRSDLLPILRKASADGRQKARERLNEEGSGLNCARRISWIQDRLICTLHTVIVDNVYPEGQDIAIAAVGGYGRGTLAPGSDIDLLFLLPEKNSDRMRKAVEFLLYVLWDLGFKVGHAPARWRNVSACRNPT